MASNRRIRLRVADPSDAPRNAPRSTPVGSRAAEGAAIRADAAPSMFWVVLLLGLFTLGAGFVFWRLGWGFAVVVIHWVMALYALANAFNDRYDRTAAALAVIILMRVW